MITEIPAHISITPQIVHKASAELSGKAINKIPTTIDTIARTICSHLNFLKASFSKFIINNLLTIYYFLNTTI